MSDKYLLSPLAQDDLDGIVDYTAGQWGIDQAALYLAQIRQHIETISLFPRTGRKCLEIGDAFYKTKTGAHVIVYRITEDGIDVARILHESMDIKKHF